MRTKTCKLIKIMRNAVIICILLLPLSAAGANRAVFRGNVVDAGGNAVKGVEIFVYNSSNTRRPADYISAKTGKSGGYNMVLPAGTYWVVARLRHGEKYGPLAIGDKHSGEPAEIDLYAGESYEYEFRVVDIRDAALLVKKVREDYIKVKGVLRDVNGVPMRNMCVIANRYEYKKEIPDFVSAWTDDQGEYTLFLPPGKYFLGYSRQYPPQSHERIIGEFDILKDREGFDMTVEEDRR